MRKAKVLICAALSAAALGGSLIAASPRPAPVAEACVVYAQSGACVLPGRTPSVTASAVTAVSPAGSVTAGSDSPLDCHSIPTGACGTSEREPVKLLATSGIRRAVGILPETEAEMEIEAEEAEAAPAYTDEERELLACAIYCEAGGDACTDETRRMVGEVILNRVADPRFPDTIAGVLTQKSQYGRFHWTGVVWPSRAAHEPEAVERAYRCAEAVLTEPRLLPEDVVFQAEFVQGEIVASAPGYYFCR